MGQFTTSISTTRHFLESHAIIMMIINANKGTILFYKIVSIYLYKILNMYLYLLVPIYIEIHRHQSKFSHSNIFLLILQFLVISIISWLGKQKVYSELSDYEYHMRNHYFFLYHIIHVTTIM